MKTVTFSSLGIDIPVSVPATVEEFNQNAKPGWTPESPENPCLDEATSNVIYRSWMAQFRPTMLHGDPDVKVQLGALQALFPDNQYLANLTPEADGLVPLPGLDDIFGMSRKGDKNEEGEVTKWTESEVTFAERIYAAQGKTADDFKDFAKLVAGLIPFDASTRARKPAAPKKTAKNYLIAADQVLATGQGAAVAAALSKILGVAVEANRESLGKAISLNEARKRAEAQKRLATELVAMVQA